MAGEQSVTAASSVDQSTPRVSVIMTTYNHQDFIAQAIEGVLSQDAVSFELIILDDVSTDATGEIIDSFVERQPRLIRVMRPPVNLNSSAETRRAVEQSVGEFVAFLDGDDYWTDPGKLRKQVAFLDENPGASMCFHDCIIIDDDGRLISDIYLPRRKIPSAGSFRDIVRTNYVASLSPLIRRSALTPLPQWADKYEWGDWALYLFAAEHGWIGYLPDRMGAYRRHSGGYITGMPLEQRFHTSLRFLNDFASHFPPSRAADFDLGIASACADLIVDQARTRNLVGFLRSLPTPFMLGTGARRFALAGKTFREFIRRFFGLLGL